VVRNERYRSHLYEARAPKEQTQRQIAGDLLKRAFEGSAKSWCWERSAGSRLQQDLAEIRSRWTSSKRGGKKNDHATEPAVDRAVWAGRFCIFCGGNSGGSLYALAGPWPVPYFRRGRYAIACASVLAMTVAPALTTGGLEIPGRRADRDLPIGAPAACPWVAYSPVTIPGNRRCRDCNGVVRGWRRRVFPPAAHGIYPQGSAAFAYAPAIRLAASPRPADEAYARARPVRLLATDRVDSPRWSAGFGR